MICHFRSRNLDRRSSVHCPKHHKGLGLLGLLGRILRLLGRILRQLGNFLRRSNLAARLQGQHLTVLAYRDRRLRNWALQLHHRERSQGRKHVQEIRLHLVHEILGDFERVCFLQGGIRFLRH